MTETATKPAPAAAPPPVAPPAPRILRWEELTKTEFDRLDRARTVVLVGCSPIEVHGPHLPLGTDPMEADGLLERLVRHMPARHRDRTFLKLPYLWVGADVLPQPGSIQFHPGTVARVVSDLGRSLGAQGFKDVLVSNFHGSPRHFLAIEQGCRDGSRRGGARMFAIFSLLVSRLAKESAGGSPLSLLEGVAGISKSLLVGDAHAGLIETAQMLALRPDLVGEGWDALPRRTVGGHEDKPGQDPSEGRPLHGIGGVSGIGRFIEEVKKNVRWFASESYAGAPAGASRERGEAILDFFGGRAAEAVGEILDGKLRPEDCASPLWKIRFLLNNPLVLRVANKLLGFRPLTA